MTGTCSLLLLEDEPLILMDLEFAAEDLGCKAFCASDIAGALRVLNGEERIDAAVLDVTLRDGETCVPVARELDARGIPYLLHSGDRNRKNETVRELGVPHIPKPANPQTVIQKAIDLTQHTPAGEVG